jgi:hypothetical protein
LERIARLDDLEIDPKKREREIAQARAIVNSI